MTQIQGTSSIFHDGEVQSFDAEVEGSVPLLDAGRSSARRNPVWMFVVEGTKMDAPERVILTAFVAVSN